MTEPQQPQRERRVARDAAVSALVSEGIFLAASVGLVLWMTRREWLMLQARRLQALVREDRGGRAEREAAEFRRDLSAWEHREG